LSARLRARTWEGWLDTVVGAVIHREVAITGIDKAMTSLYRMVGWMLFTRIGVSILVLLGGLGFLLFLHELFSVGRNPFTIDGSAGLGLLALIGLSLVLLAIHELGHAMAVKAFGREVNRAGFTMFYGMPAFFVDSTDIWMEPRRARMAVTAAGPLVTWAAGGAAMLYLVLAPESLWTQIAYQLALISFINNSFNIVPFLELDGHYLLMDWLELPLLRARALAFRP
jgi:putative peptide zinc metalloprotease protein